jgi:hypothetical protein
VNRKKSWTMTSAELETIRRRLTGVSPGPWEVRRMPNGYPSLVGDRRTHPCVRGFRVPRKLYELAHQQFENDAEFMAVTRHDVPALVEEVDALRAAIVECRAAVVDLLQRHAEVTPETLARLREYLEGEEARWTDGKVRQRKLYLAQPPIRPRDRDRVAEAS